MFEKEATTNEDNNEKLIVNGTPISENRKSIEFKAMNQERSMSYDSITTDVLEEIEENQRKINLLPVIKGSNAFQSFMNSVKLFFGNVYLTIPNVF